MSNLMLPLEERLKQLKKDVRKSLLERGLKPILEVYPDFIRFKVKGYLGAISSYSDFIEAVIQNKPGEQNQTLDLLRESLEACNIQVRLYSDLYRELI